MKRDDRIVGPCLWEVIFEDIFVDFLRFFFEDADIIFDMSRGFQFLDKELEQLF